MSPPQWSCVTQQTSSSLPSTLLAPSASPEPHRVVLSHGLADGSAAAPALAFAAALRLPAVQKPGDDVGIAPAEHVHLGKTQHLRFATQSTSIGADPPLAPQHKGPLVQAAAAAARARLEDLEHNGPHVALPRGGRRYEGAVEMQDALARAAAEVKPQGTQRHLDDAPGRLRRRQGKLGSQCHTGDKRIPDMRPGPVESQSCAGTTP